MQTLTPSLTQHLAQEVTTLATCWKITRRDQAQLFFTDHDVDLTIGAETYRAAGGIVPSAVTSQAGLSVDNLELEGMLSHDTITQDDVLNGLYDHAELTIFMVNTADTNSGKLHVKTGWLGEVTLRDGVFVVEVRGISAALQQTIGDVYTPTCRAQLGDARCKKSLTSYRRNGAVDVVDSQFAFVDQGRNEAAGYFAYGTLTFTSGANASLSMEVRDYAAGRFGLFLPMPYPITVGDQFSVVAGCDKRFDTCVSRFNNAINFRGEPHVPGNDRMFETAATRSS